MLQMTLGVAGVEDYAADLVTHFPEVLLPGSKFDLLAHARKHVPGTTLPVLRLRAAGCWTGPQTGALGMSQVMINYGPGVAEWWVIDASNAVRFRDFFMRQEGIDFWREPQWWPDENLLMTEGLNVNYVRQLPGDVLYIGPGAFFWTKNKDDVITLRWAIGRKTKHQVETMFERDAVDRNLARSNSLRAYTLAADILNSEMTTLDDEIVQALLARLEKRFKEEKDYAENSGIVCLGVNPAHDITDCVECRSGVFYAYCMCDVCGACVCVPCAIKHKHSLPLHYTACAAEVMERLIQRAQRRLSEPCADCFDPGLTAHSNALRKWEGISTLLACEKGQPSCALFHTDTDRKVRRKRRREKAPKKHKKPRDESAMKELAALLDPTTPPHSDNDPSAPVKHAKLCEELALEVAEGQIRD